MTERDQIIIIMILFFAAVGLVIVYSTTVSWSKAIEVEAGTEVTQRLIRHAYTFNLTNTSTEGVGLLTITSSTSSRPGEFLVQTGSIFQYREYYMKVTFLANGHMWLLVSNQPIADR